MISESDIFGSEKKKKKHHRTYEGEKIASFTDLNIGDYVVHEIMDLASTVESKNRGR